MRLCSLSGWVKIAADGELGLMREKRGAQARQLLVGLQSAEAFGGFDHGRARPAQRHGGVAPPLHIAADPADGAFMFSMMLVQANDRRS
jgi:hypothetical protein